MITSHLIENIQIQTECVCANFEIKNASCDE